MTIAMVDLKCGNLASVRFALERLDAPHVVTSDPSAIAAAPKVILPGVGSAEFAAERIDALSLRETLRGLRQPLLGICLGMQLLYDASDEGDATCIGKLPGRVTKLPHVPSEPWPHMGWSKLAKRGANSRLLDGVEDGAYAYFVHGFACPIDEATVATARYGVDFAAAVEQDNVFGCQFHPERSAEAGARILQNFLDVPC
jgi:glutamine amidotransferase